MCADRDPQPTDLRLASDDGTAVALRWRAFGAADLEVNLQGASRTTLVTELLARCLADAGDVPAGRSDARRLTLAGRIGGLAAIVARTDGSDQVALELRCPVATCGVPLQIGLSLAWLLERSQEAEDARAITVAMPRGGALSVRRPTGNDQHAWQSRTYADAASAERAMVASLLPAGRGAALDDDDLVAIDAALEEADTLSCFHVAATCPECGTESGHAIDLEALLVARLQRLQRGLLHDIHRLAARYGWSERAIAGLPDWRRRAYLDLLEREAS
jgi:hypothetical protein